MGKKVFLLFSYLLSLIVSILFLPLVNPALAIGTPPSCQSIGVSFSDVKPTYDVREEIKFGLTLDPNGDFARKQVIPERLYNVVIVPTSITPPKTPPVKGEYLLILEERTRFIFTFSPVPVLNPDSNYNLEFGFADAGLAIPSICTGPAFKINPYNPFGQTSCQPDVPSEILVNKPHSVPLHIISQYPETTYSFLIYRGKIDSGFFQLQTNAEWTNMEGKYAKVNEQAIPKAYEPKDIPALGLGDYTLVIKASKDSFSWGCSVQYFTTVNRDPSNVRAPGGAAPGVGEAPAIPGAKVCTAKDIEEGRCSSGGGDPCDTKDNRGPAFKTAIGCIHTSPAELVKDVLTFVIGISGGLAFLMMLLGAFQMLSSAGNPETLNAGRERLTSAVIGLLFVIFAVLLLQIIGVDILKIPGFGR